MQRSLTRASQALLGFGVAVAATLTAALSHMLAGAQSANFLAIIISTLVSWPFAAFIIGKKARAINLAAAVFTSQAFFHFVFVWFVPLQIKIAHNHNGQIIGTFAPNMNEHHSGLAMTLAHAVAAVCAYIFVRAAQIADATVHTALAYLLGQLCFRCALVSLPFAARPKFPKLTWRYPAELISQYLQTANRLRGPPIFA